MYARRVSENVCVLPRECTNCMSVCMCMYEYVCMYLGPCMHDHVYDGENNSICMRA